MSELDNYWPKAVAHLKEPYDNGVSDHVVIAEISEAAQNGYKGFRKIGTALIPLESVNEVLQSPGGIGHEVQSWGPHPCVDNGQTYDTKFWIDGRTGKDERFQTIINAWNHHDREVLLPDNVMLMAYGLVPRYLGDGTVCWDDPQRPTYDVLRVKSHVKYGDKKGELLGQITIRRDYLEDYCHLKACAAVAVYYEERFSSDDDTFNPVLKGKEGVQLELPGRSLDMVLLDGKYHDTAPQMSKVWGTRLILVPKERPISDSKDLELIWPGDNEPMTYPRASATWVYGYVCDDVLKEYESHMEYELYPESGGVGYGGWWSTDRTRRVGRHHICVELKKLYEGCPPHVIAYWHRFAVPESVAAHDRATHGDRNIAVRAKDVVQAYLALTASLERLSDRLGIEQTQEDIGTLTNEDLEYRGWWSPEVVRPLYAVVPLTATQEMFLNRTVSLFKVLELLKPGPLRTLARQLGVPKDQIKDFASLKLLACICQLAKIAKTHGHSMTEDAATIVKQWNPAEELQQLASLFALNGLRVCQSHTPGNEREVKIASAAKRVGIDVTATASGWGYAIDTLYDRLAEDLSGLAKIIDEA